MTAAMDAAGSGHGGEDPLVPVLAGLVVDLVRFLDECEDDEVDPDAAVRIAEHVSWVLLRLPEEQRDRFLRVLDEAAVAEPDPARRAYLRSFPHACGLVEDAEG
ncbi:hypothetical protein [Kitasatospora camelliae]|uniref:Uncharacterized protein n=1 Tax=Kitasatospora camelliae TaxID=3156397 RepID=A0AAU8JRH3_9ACTN